MDCLKTKSVNYHQRNRTKNVIQRKHKVNVSQQKQTKLPDEIATRKVKSSEGETKWKHMLHLAMKERMWLERQLAILTQSLQHNSEGDVNRYVQLSHNNNLFGQVEFLKTVDQQLKVKDEEFHALEQKLIEKNQICEQLVAELKKFEKANLELSTKRNETQAELQRLQQQLRHADDEKKQLEREHGSVRAQLQEEQAEIKKLHWSKEVERKQSTESIETLESKLRELEKKCELQKVRHEELVLEMDAVRRIQSKKEQMAIQEEAELSAKEALLTATLNSLKAEENSFTSNVVNHAGEGAAVVVEKSSTGLPAATRSAILEATASEIDRIMAKLEQDNKILAELDRTRASIGLSSVGAVTIGTASTFTAKANCATSKVESSGYFSSSSVTTTATTTTTTTTSNLVSVSTVPAPNPRNVINSSKISTLVHNPTTIVPAGLSVPTIITTLADHEGRTVHGDSSHASLGNEELSGHVNLPAFGKVKVFVARYTYDPLQHSPNENPEAELAVSSGDYVLVKGDIDEDGFYDGQLLDGRRGLVPSNFIEKLSGEDLLEFYQNFLYGFQESEESMTSLPADFNLDGIIDDNQMLIVVIPHSAYNQKNCLPGDVLCLTNLDNIDEAEEFLNEANSEDVFFSMLVPPPQNLVLERQFHKSILISWTAPPAPQGSIESFNVYVDGELRVTVLATERTRALVEGVESQRPHRISVRSVTPNRRMSVDAACTMIIGKGVPVAPSCVRASNITSTSAIISWLPSNSNLQHVVCVNSVEVRMLKPGVYRHTITGLSPNTTYRVTVRVKNIKSPYTDEKTAGRLETSSTSVDFRTLPKGLPDPPLDVQVEPGPQDGTLLVTWLPVTINTTGTSNGSQVTGYAVYTDGKKVVDIDSPTGDHALIDICKLHITAPKHVTVRTKSGDSVSSDSVQVSIGAMATLQASKQNKAKTSSKKKVKEDEYHEESSERSELSDIAEEVEEDAMMDAANGKSRSRSKEWMKASAESERVKATEREASTKKMEVSKSRKDVERAQAPSSGGGKSGAPRSHAADRRSGGGPRRHDSMGQTVIEPEENLSDKEIYPSSHMAIPAIEITKDSASEGRNSMDYSDEEYDLRRGVRDKRAVVAGGGGRRQAPPPDAASHRVHRGGGDHHQQQQHHHHHPPPREQHRVRSFVALFDYDPKTMSPNPGAAMEELPFREGQLIKIYGDKDPDGFYWGEAMGRQGFVPCNMVSQVQGDEETVTHSRRAVPPPRRTDQQQQQTAGHRYSSRSKSSGRDNRWSDIHDQGQQVKKMIALYDYDPQELSPNVDAEVELSFNTGDIIYVHGDMDEDGFFMGEMNGIRGLVPSNFLTDAPADYADEPLPPRSSRHAGGEAPPPTKVYNPHGGMERRAPPPPGHIDSNRYGQQARSGGQRW